MDPELRLEEASACRQHQLQATSAAAEWQLLPARCQAGLLACVQALRLRAGRRTVVPSPKKEQAFLLSRLCHPAEKEGPGWL